MTQHPIILISGHMRTGKDTFFHLLSKRNAIYKRYAFADALKQDLRGFLWEKMEIDINTAIGKEKELVRPVMIAYGCAQRNASNGLHWVKRVESQIVNDLEFSRFSSPIIPVVTDVRFENEAIYFKERYSCVLVEIQKENAPEPPEEEKINQPKLRKHVDFFINWPDVDGKIDSLAPFVEDFAKKYNFP